MGDLSDAASGHISLQIITIKNQDAVRNVAPLPSNKLVWYPSKHPGVGSPVEKALGEDQPYALIELLKSSFQRARLGLLPRQSLHDHLQGILHEFRSCY